MKAIISIFSVLIAAILISPVSTSGSSDSKAKSDSSFCISCHVMQAEYEAWMHSGVHRRNMCVDCHLPNQNKAVHYLWKSIDGLKDVIVYYSGYIPEQIKISSHGEIVLQVNCIRCHETTVTMIDKERKCWGCHKRISHMHTGVMQTL